MGCNCAGRNQGVTYPREVTLDSGKKVTVTSLADERVQKERDRQQQRANARTTGYTVRR